MLRVSSQIAQRVVVAVTLCIGLPGSVSAAPTRDAGVEVSLAPSARDAGKESAQKAPAGDAKAAPSTSNAKESAPAQASENTVTASLFGLAAFAVGSLVLAFGWLLWRFNQALSARLPIGVRDHWGGFGGGVSGWEVSPTLSLLVILVVVALAIGLASDALLSAAIHAAERSQQPGDAPSRAEH